ncbi:MAG: hypothetical protein GY870_12475 [archaeon]|nr:hypothetical protein [archaeon]
MGRNTVMIFGTKYIPDGRVKRILRKSPKANARARAVAKCARAVGKGNSEEKIKARKACFAGSKGVTGK